MGGGCNSFTSSLPPTTTTTFERAGAATTQKNDDTKGIYTSTKCLQWATLVDGFAQCRIYDTLNLIVGRMDGLLSCCGKCFEANVCRNSTNYAHSSYRDSLGCTRTCKCISLRNTHPENRIAIAPLNEIWVDGGWWQPQLIFFFFFSSSTLSLLLIQLRYEIIIWRGWCLQCIVLMVGGYLRKSKEMGRHLLVSDRDNLIKAPSVMQKRLVFCFDSGVSCFLWQWQ